VQGGQFAMQFVHVHAEQCTSPPIACQARFSIQFLQGLPAHNRGRKQSTYVIKNMFTKTQIIYITSTVVIYEYILAFALQ
jgi:hypothetical protein